MTDVIEAIFDFVEGPWDIVSICRLYSLQIDLSFSTTKNQGTMNICFVII